LNDYVHATYVRGMAAVPAYIVAQVSGPCARAHSLQSPMLNTLEEFWRLIWQENVAVIINLQHKNTTDMCALYFDVRKTKTMRFGKHGRLFSVKTIEVEKVSCARNARRLCSLTKITCTTPCKQS
jgi:protein tyrosine phosphatase